MFIVTKSTRHSTFFRFLAIVSEVIDVIGIWKTFRESFSIELCSYVLIEWRQTIMIEFYLFQKTHDILVDIPRFTFQCLWIYWDTAIATNLIVANRAAFTKNYRTFPTLQRLTRDLFANFAAESIQDRFCNFVFVSNIFLGKYNFCLWQLLQLPFYKFFY